MRVRYEGAWAEDILVLLIFLGNESIVQASVSPRTDKYEHFNIEWYLALHVEGSGFPRCTQHNVHVRLFLYHLLLMTSTPNARIDTPHFSIRSEL